MYTGLVKLAQLGEPARMFAAYVGLLAEMRRRPTAADELRFAHSGDGWRIALHRYRPAAGVAPRRHPVILCHGLAANRVTFDLSAEVSLARRLAGLGFDVYCLELRSHGSSQAARLAGPRRWGFSFDDYLGHDVPAAIDEVRALTGAPRVHWIGHSMGGILLYAHLASGGAAQLASGVAIGSGLDYSGSVSAYHSTLGLRRYGGLSPVIPIGFALALTQPWNGRAGLALKRFNLWPDNVEPHLVRRLHARAFHSVSTAVLLQLATAFEPGGLRSRDHSRCYLHDLRAAAVTTPVLALAGDRDAQCSVEAAAVPLAALAGRAQLAACGREYGHSSHYGHFDLVIGRRAHVEVWPAIEAWLAEHD
jgi:alpha-beta hydrolase superfamily lysophospholipase